MKTRLLFLLLFLGLIITTQAQVSINHEGNDPHESAMLDVSSNEKGLLIPRMTTEERDAIINPANGLMVFDYTSNTFWFYSEASSSWEEMGGAIVSMLNDLLDAQTDANSIYIGHQSGTNNDGNNFNTALGMKSLKDNTAGSKNTAIGYSSLNTTTTGNYNTSLGWFSLANNTTGNNNTAIGTKAGSSADENSSGNIFLGYEAGKNENGSNKLYIENSDSPTPLIGGNFESDEVVINGTLEVSESLNVWSSINTQENLAVGQNLIVNDSISTQALKITAGTIGDGKILTSDANGNASWQELPNGINEINDLEDAKTSVKSIFLGENTGVHDNGDFNFNVAIGIESFHFNQDGKYNNILGTHAMHSNISGSENAAIGYSALRNNIEGNKNIAVGSMSLYKNESGSMNIAIGDYALFENKGNRNIAIGINAGLNSENSHSNIFLGYDAGKNEMGSNKLYIENSDSDNPLIGGDFETDELIINGDLEVDGTIKINGGNPADGLVLTSDANGNASWQAGSEGATNLNDLSDAKVDDTNIFLGEEAGMYSDENTYNSAMGHFALLNNSSGKYNSALGYSALSENTTGEKNVAIGHFSIGNSLNGNQNVAMGYKTLDNLVNGNNNTVIGHEAGSSIGENASGNVFLGNEAGKLEQGSNKLYIENSDSDSPLIGGDFEMNEVEINGDLNINGNIKITEGNPGEGKILTSDAYGNATWTESTGAQSINDLSDGKTKGNSTYLGNGAGSYENVETLSTGVGSQALLKNRGNNNNAFGFNAMKETDSGESNTAFGNSSLINNAEGSFNAAYGNSTLSSLETGNGNTAIGYKAGEFIGENTSGCVFIGQQAGSNELNNNKLYIENSNSNTPLIGGDFETDEVVINGSLQITGNNPGAGKFLSSDENGKASWSILPEGVTSIDDLSDARNDGSSIYLGYGGYNDDGENRNTTLGRFALAENTSGQNNVAVGESSLLYNTSGDNNSAFGKGALENTSDGDENTAIGYRALHYNNSGSKNTALGFEAGRGFNNSNRVGNVFLGYHAGRFENGSNKLYISNSDTAAPLIYGDFKYHELDFNGDVAVEGSLKITGGNPGNNKILTSDPWGNASWKDLNTLGLSTLDDLDDAISSDHSIFLGESSGINDSGNNRNTAVGINSLNLNSTGTRNTAVGNQSLENSTNSSDNVAVGYNALNSISYTGGNVAIGSFAGSETQGGSNVLIGSSTGEHFIGHRNVLIGAGAGKNATSSNSIFIGYHAGMEANEDNVLYIDNSETEEPLIKGDFYNDEIVINGDLILPKNKDIKFEEPKTGYLTLHASDFNYEHSATSSYSEYDHVHYKAGGLFITYGFALTKSFYAPIHLPDGAKIKKIYAYYSGEGVADYFSIGLGDYDPSEPYLYGDHLYLELEETSLNISQHQTLSSGNNIDRIINENESSFCKFKIEINDADSEFILKGVKIKYEYQTIIH